MTIKIEISSGLSVTEAEAVIHLIQTMAGLSTAVTASALSVDERLAVLDSDPKLVRVDPVEEEEEQPNANPPAVDSLGLPWDERIHASTRTTNKDGTWKFKRGVDKELVKQVGEELRAAIKGPPAPPAPPAPAPETAAPPAPPAPPAPETAAPPAPPAPAPETAAPPAPPATPEQAIAEAAVSPFVGVMKRVTAMQGAGTLSKERLAELLEMVGAESVIGLRGNDVAIAAFTELLDAE